MTATALLLRTIGMFFRVYMSNKIGAEGMGLYQLIFSIYVLGSTFATSGICTAVTRLVTDELVTGTKKSVNAVLRKAIILSVLIGVVSALLIFFGADPISRYWLKDMRAVPALKVLCFSLPSMGVSSCLRGYFIARRKAASPSRAQIFEQIVRIGVVVFLIDRFAAFGLTFACVAVMLGDTLAEIASCLYLAAGYFHDRRKVEIPPSPPVKQRHGVLYRLLAIAAPITAGRYLNTILRTIENILVPSTLAQYSGSKEKALSSFGALKGHGHAPAVLPLVLPQFSVHPAHPRNFRGLRPPPAEKGQPGRGPDPPDYPPVLHPAQRPVHHVRPGAGPRDL